MTDENRGWEIELVDQCGDVCCHSRATVICVGCPVALAVAWEVQRGDVEVLAHVQAEEVPDVGLEQRAVEQQHGWEVVALPVQQVEAVAVDEVLLAERRSWVCDVEAVGPRGGDDSGEKLLEGRLIHTEYSSTNAPLRSARATPPRRGPLPWGTTSVGRPLRGGPLPWRATPVGGPLPWDHFR